jgi:hypothetical protein
MISSTRPGLIDMAPTFRNGQLPQGFFRLKKLANGSALSHINSLMHGASPTVEVSAHARKI